MSWTTQPPKTSGYAWFRRREIRTTDAGDPVHGLPVPMRLAETQILGVDGLWWSEPIPEPPCEIPYFDSVHLGRLVDHEENRLAAAAADDRGWPMEQMTGARVDDPGAAKSGLSLRQMAVIRYTSWKGSEP